MRQHQGHGLSRADTTRLGILCGTFDPVHLGHTFVAEQARRRLGLHEVVFIPAGQPHWKLGHAVTTAKHRVEMVRLAISENPWFQLCTVEVEREESPYTVETVDALRRRMPSSQLYLVMGMDTLLKLPLWKNAERIVTLCRLVVVPRSGIDLSELNRVLRELMVVSKMSVLSLNCPIVEISSSTIRDRVARHLSIDGLVHDDVKKYITANSLYRDPPVI